MGLLCLGLGEAQAQYAPSYSHYWAMEPVFNPAAAGKDPMLNVTGAYNMSLTGFKRNPKTMNFAADLPFKFLGAIHGVGAIVTNDQLGLFSHKTFAVQYSYKHRLFGGQIGVGIQASMLSENFDGGKLDLEESGDPAFSSSEVNGSHFDLGAGLYYKRGQWWVGFSAQHLMSPTIALGETNELNVDASYYLTSGCNIKLRNPLLTIHPSVLGRYDGTSWRADATVRLKYTHDKKVLYCGVGYSPTNSATVLIGGSFHGVMLGYSYEIYTSALSLGNGAHELFVSYQTPIDLGKKGRNRHQSVRIL